MNKLGLINASLIWALLLMIGSNELKDIIGHMITCRTHRTLFKTKEAVVVQAWDRPEKPTRTQEKCDRRQPNLDRISSSFLAPTTLSNPNEQINRIEQSHHHRHKSPQASHFSRLTPSLSPSSMHDTHHHRFTVHSFTHTIELYRAYFL